MIGLACAARIFLRRLPTDMRKSFDGLSGIVRGEFGRDPLAGDLFVFVNRRRDFVKALYWDRDGLVLTEDLSLVTLFPTNTASRFFGLRMPAGYCYLAPTQ